MLYSDKIFNAYFGQCFGNNAELCDDEVFVELDDVNEGDVLQHKSGSVFKVMAVDEGFTSCLEVVACFDNGFTRVLYDDYLSECYRMDRYAIM